MNFPNKGFAKIRLKSFDFNGFISIQKNCSKSEKNCGKLLTKTKKKSIIQTKTKINTEKGVFDYGYDERVRNQKRNV